MIQETKEQGRIWRFLALLSVVVNILFNYLSDSFMPGKSVAAVSAEYDSLFTPSPYAFSIWGLIYLSFFAYAVVQLMPSRRSDPIYDRLAGPFILSNILGMAWISAFRLNMISLSMILIVVMLTISLILYIQVRNVVLKSENSGWLSVPFSLYSGWLCVAMIAQSSIFIVYLGWSGDITTQLVTTLVAIAAASTLALMVGYRCADVIFPLVICWAFVAIFISQNQHYPVIGAAALVGGIFPAGWILAASLKRIIHHHRVRANKFSFDETFRRKLNRQNKLFFGRL